MTNNKYIKGLLEHDSKVLEMIYSQFAHRIQSYVTQRGGTTDDARDVFQDALMIIYKKAQKSDIELTSEFYTYLNGVCHFLWLKKNKKNKKKSNSSVTISEETELISEEHIEKDIELREKHRVFRENIAKLGESCQRILRLFFAKKTMTEIAETLGIENEHAVRSRKYRCVKKLEKLIQSDTRYQELR